MRVLIVEDVPAEAELFADLVAHHGHDPIVAATAEAALESLAASSPDAVLLDMFLPGMSGLELLQILSERRQQCPVVVISGVATEDQARRCLELGAVEFVPKPLTIDQLKLLLDFLEAQLLTRRLSGQTQTANRRRYARAQVALDVTLEDTTGRQWQGQSVDLSPFGMKLLSARPLEPGGTARLSFDPRDGNGRITVLALMVRKDPDGQAYAFINLTNGDFTRLKTLVDSRLPRSA